MEWNLRLADAARIELRAGRTEELVVGRLDLRVVVKGSGWIVGPWMERVQHGPGRGFCVVGSRGALKPGSTVMPHSLSSHSGT